MRVNIKKKGLKFYNKHRIRINYVKDFMLIALLYGLLLAFTLSVILPSHFKFNLAFIVALGLARYFVIEEIPKVIRKSIK